jgi:hypothetical protein
MRGPGWSVSATGRPASISDRPLFEASNREPLSDATPFTLPGTISDAVIAASTGSHTEGAHPGRRDADRRLGDDHPGGIGGLYRLTRELVDSPNHSGECRSAPVPGVPAGAMAASKLPPTREWERLGRKGLRIGPTTALKVTAVPAAPVWDGHSDLPEGFGLHSGAVRGKGANVSVPVVTHEHVTTIDTPLPDGHHDQKISGAWPNSRPASQLTCMCVCRWGSEYLSDNIRAHLPFHYRDTAGSEAGPGSDGPGR